MTGALQDLRSCVALCVNANRCLALLTNRPCLYSVFPVRGQPDHDREFRHPRTRAERPKGTGKRTADSPDANDDPWESLPPLEDLIDGVNRFTRYYFQLGFIAKKQYSEKLRSDHRSCSLFLLLSILSISARLSPALRGRFGTGVKASDFFMDRASELALAEIYAEPTLERCQAFYLLSIAQQGSGIRNKSYVRCAITHYRSIHDAPKR